MRERERINSAPPPSSLDDGRLMDLSGATDSYGLCPPLPTDDRQETRLFRIRRLRIMMDAARRDGQEPGNPDSSPRSNLTRVSGAIIAQRV